MSASTTTESSGAVAENTAELISAAITNVRPTLHCALRMMPNLFYLVLLTQCLQHTIESKLVASVGCSSTSSFSAVLKIITPAVAAVELLPQTARTQDDLHAAVNWDSSNQELCTQ